MSTGAVADLARVKVQHGEKWLIKGQVARGGPFEAIRRGTWPPCNLFAGTPAELAAEIVAHEQTHRRQRGESAG